jgi:hypothetical protein
MAAKASWSWAGSEREEWGLLTLRFRLEERLCRCRGALQSPSLSGRPLVKTAKHVSLGSQETVPHSEPQYFSQVLKMRVPVLAMRSSWAAEGQLSCVIDLGSSVLPGPCIPF